MKVMAKIVVTTENGSKILVDVNSNFKAFGNRVILFDANNANYGGVSIHVIESMEEIRKRINEAEAESTNPKLDLILKNQEEILRILKSSN